MPYSQTGYPSVDRPWLKYYKKDIYELPDTDTSMFRFLYECNKNRLDDIALNYFGKQISFRSMFVHIDSIALMLRNLGVRKGQYVSLCALNIPEFFYLLYAVNKIGAVCNWIGLTSPIADIHEQLVTTKSEIVFTVSIAYEQVLDAAINTNVNRIIAIPVNNSMPIFMKTIIEAFSFFQKGIKFRKSDFIETIKWGNIYDVKKNKEVMALDQADSQLEGNNIAMIEYTGGTTGVPKGVMLSNKALNSYYINFALSNINGMSHYKERESYFSGVPLFLAFGVSACCHGPLCHGMELILAPDPSPKAGMKIILKSRVNHIITGRVMIEGIIKELSSRKKADLSHIYSVMYGGEESNKKWEKSVEERLSHYNMRASVLNGYGMTECAAAVMIELNNEKGGMIPLGNVNVKVVDPDDFRIELGYGIEGELCISSNTIMEGYYGRIKETKDVIFEDKGAKWLRTHDLAVISVEGYITITGRMKRIFSKLTSDDIQVRVYPMRTEEVIMSDKDVKMCAVIGIKDDITAYRTVAYIIRNSIKEDEESTLQRIDVLCRRKLPESHVPDKYIFVDEFPLTRAGKVDYRELESRAGKL
ncbi:MAG: acyl--CoA ligase [Butyrivibrio sp.]|nr:acyl--CoA ligase [Butyrivibrio sp.]